MFFLYVLIALEEMLILCQMLCWLTVLAVQIIFQICFGALF